MAPAATSPEWQFELLGGRLCLDFANTVSGMRGGDARDHLGDYAALLSWGLQTGAVEEPRARTLLAHARKRPGEAGAVFRDAIALREAIHAIFRAFAEEKEPAQDDLDLLSRALGRALAHRRIRRGGGACCALGWDESGTDLDAVLWPVVASAAELLVSGEELSLLRICGMHESGECGWLFLDETRNHTRRWCSMKDCGNRAKARRHYQRASGKA